MLSFGFISTCASYKSGPNFIAKILDIKRGNIRQMAASTGMAALGRSLLRYDYTVNKNTQSSLLKAVPVVLKSEELGGCRMLDLLC